MKKPEATLHCLRLRTFLGERNATEGVRYMVAYRTTLATASLVGLTGAGTSSTFTLLTA